MSFTDQKQRIATEKIVNTWGGSHEKGNRFRCYLCGHKFIAGDKWRWVNADKVKLMNFLICGDCDYGNNNIAIEKWKELNLEFEKLSDGKYWWYINNLKEEINQGS